MSGLMRANLGSARVARAGERVLAIADFSWNSESQDMVTLGKSLFRRDAETNTRDACATLRTRDSTIWKSPTIIAKFACASFPLSRRQPALRRRRLNTRCHRSRHADLRLQRGDNSRSLRTTRRRARAARSPDLLCGKGELESRDPELARRCGRRLRHCFGGRIVSCARGRWRSGQVHIRGRRQIS